MASTLEHRGPDDQGVWVSAARGVGLGFRRLAIIDLSALGHQPMRSASGRFTMVFNGEVYNHRVLRAELAAAGATFRGHSDTEVILAAFEAWGIEAAVRQFVGMFAIAVWDEDRCELTMLRDRLGIKPLYVYAEPGRILFGSELKALAAVPGFDRTPDRDALTTYLRYLHVPAPATAYSRVRKLLPGHRLVVTDPRAPLPESTPYWSVSEAMERGLATPHGGTDEEVLDQLRELLRDAVRLRLEADVPLGALLSGGIDSSLTVALMQSLVDRPVRTFTVGFDDPAHDETAHAREVSRHLGTSHTELHLTGNDALAVVPRLAEMFDEPHADPSQIPTYLVCELARRQVTVALTGDGGDELFAGYNRYVAGEVMIQRAGHWPRLVRRLAGRGLLGVAPEQWDRVHQALAPVLPETARTRLPGAKLRKIGRLLQAETPALRYRTLMSAWEAPQRFLQRGRDLPTRAAQLLSHAAPGQLLDQMMLTDQLEYLPDDLLAKVDRASMAVSLEARVPLLDHRVVEFSWSLPRRFKIRDGQGKWALRQLLYRDVPRAIVDREKTGFSVPIAGWLRGPLRGWAEDLLAPGRLSRLGLMEPVAVQQAWRKFQAGTSSEGTGVWALVMLAAWQERWLA